MKKFDTYMVNKIFTVPYLDRMISEDSIPDTFFECVRRYVKTDDATIGEAISEIYHFMNYEYRNEYYYKNTILNQLLIKKHDLYNTAALTESPIGDSKADFIMINGRGVVYEIKTDLDNLIRLENQLKDYYKVFSYIYVVVGKKQLPHRKYFFMCFEIVISWKNFITSQLLLKYVHKIKEIFRLIVTDVTDFSS